MLKWPLYLPLPCIEEVVKLSSHGLYTVLFVELLSEISFRPVRYSTLQIQAQSQFSKNTFNIMIVISFFFHMSSYLHGEIISKHILSPHVMRCQSRVYINSQL
jgi:hypothetical protein